MYLNNDKLAEKGEQGRARGGMARPVRVSSHRDRDKCPSYRGNAIIPGTKPRRRVFSLLFVHDTCWRSRTKASGDDLLRDELCLSAGRIILHSS